ncbi:MAG: GDP-mannose 4,6-dehydratase [Candidatus Saganbacteria bacterium]|nr:GDP-mannose 4,6-dehydratase [Candidatus Saganbacteria bacterium]
MKKAVIIGCKGQDGRLLYEFLREKKYSLVGLDINYSLSTRPSKKYFVDISDASQVLKFLNSFKPDEIYYLAAYHHSSQDSPEDNLLLFKRSFNTNTISLIYFLEGMRRYAPKARLFYAASSRIFGESATGLKNEKSEINPECVYGITKASGYYVCRFYRKKHAIFASTGILFNHESHLRDDKFVSKKIIKAVAKIKRKKQKKLILGNLQAEVDWGYAPDYVRAMYKTLQIKHADDFVIATGKKHRVVDFVKIAFAYAGLDWRDYVETKPTIIGKKRKPLVGNPRKIKKLTGWVPSVNFRQMIELLLKKEGVKRAG